MHSYLVEMVACPECHSELTWNIGESSSDRIETASIHCVACNAEYEVREGIGMFLTPDLVREDLWEQTDSQLSLHLFQHPEIEHQLLGVPLEDLAPADQFFRAQILEERGELEQAKIAAESADSSIYTSEYRACAESQIEQALQHLVDTDDPIVDLASGKGQLVEKMARRFTRPIVATDFSPLVLRRDRRRLEHIGLYNDVSLLAFDARRTPFKDGALQILTTYQGLQNIREPGDVLNELRRVVSGFFLSLSVFLPEDDHANRVAVEGLGLSTHFFRKSALESMVKAGWNAELLDACHCRAMPTPTGEVIRGAMIDAIPVAPTTLEWSLLLGTTDAQKAKR